MNCGPMTERLLECTEDAFLGGRLRLRQLKKGHRAGHDATLLAAGTSARRGMRVGDFGAGARLGRGARAAGGGGVGLARRPAPAAGGLAVARCVEGIHLALVEIDE